MKKLKKAAAGILILVLAVSMLAIPSVSAEASMHQCLTGPDYAQEMLLMKSSSSGQEETLDGDAADTPDMSKVSLEKNSLTLVGKSSYYYTVATGSVKLISDYNFSYSYDLDIQVSSSNENMYIYWDLQDNVFTFECYGSGQTTITIVLNGKTMTLNLKVVEIAMNSTAVLLWPNKTKYLKVKNASSSSIVWESSDPSVVKVSKTGAITGVNCGNAIITATIDGSIKVGSAVSVTTVKKVKAIKKAQSIASTSTYSQAKRMQTGYYDCSSLVWRSYSPYGYYFGSRSYAPTAAGIAVYLYKNKKLKGACTYEDTQNMVMQAGDVIFQTGSDNGRFKGIYHVELFTGYRFCYFDGSGQPVVTTTWAARSDGYGNVASLYGRP